MLVELGTKSCVSSFLRLTHMPRSPLFTPSTPTFQVTHNSVPPRRRLPRLLAVRGAHKVEGHGEAPTLSHTHTPWSVQYSGSHTEGRPASSAQDTKVCQGGCIRISGDIHISGWEDTWQCVHRILPWIRTGVLGWPRCGHFGHLGYWRWGMAARCKGIRTWRGH